MAKNARRKAYPTDLTDAQWAVLEPFLRPNAGPGRPTKLDLREIVNALVYYKQTGCPWRYLPHDFPKWASVRYYFDKWTADGTLEDLNRRLREQVREHAGRAPQPTAGIVDSQTVKAVEGGGARGWDGNKKLHGRKRHVLVDVTGCLLGVLVLAADVSDGLAGLTLLGLVIRQFPHLALIWADQAYRGDFVSHARRHWEVVVEIVSKLTTQAGFTVLPKRWIVERTLGWLVRGRRLRCDYERDPAYSEAWIYISAVHRMVQVLTRTEADPRPYQRRKIA